MYQNVNDRKIAQLLFYDIFGPWLNTFHCFSVYSLDVEEVVLLVVVHQNLGEHGQPNTPETEKKTELK